MPRLQQNFLHTLPFRRGRQLVADQFFLAGVGTPKVLGTASLCPKVLQHCIPNPQSIPGQGVHPFWHKKLAAAGDGENGPDGPMS